MTLLIFTPVDYSGPCVHDGESDSDSSYCGSACLMAPGGADAIVNTLPNALLPDSWQGSAPRHYVYECLNTFDGDGDG